MSRSYFCYLIFSVIFILGLKSTASASQDGAVLAVPLTNDSCIGNLGLYTSFMNNGTDTVFNALFGSSVNGVVQSIIYGWIPWRQGK